MRVGLLVRTMNRHTFVVKPEVWIVTDEIDDDVWEIYPKENRSEYNQE